jgi:hypothetical protein
MRYLIQTEAEASTAFKRIDAYLAQISAQGEDSLSEAENDDFRATALAIQEYEQMQHPRPTVTELIERHFSDQNSLEVA